MKFHESASQMRQAAARYEPTDMLQVHRDFARLPEACADFAAAHKIIVEKAAQGWPLHPSVIATLATVHQLITKAGEAAAQVAPAMRTLHEADMRRLEQPRPGEPLWNVGRAGGGAGPVSHRK